MAMENRKFFNNLAGRRYYMPTLRVGRGDIAAVMRADESTGEGMTRRDDQRTLRGLLMNAAIGDDVTVRRGMTVLPRIDRARAGAGADPSAVAAAFSPTAAVAERVPRARFVPVNRARDRSLRSSFTTFRRVAPRRRRRNGVRIERDASGVAARDGRDPRNRGICIYI